MKSVILVTIEKYYSSLLLALFGFFSAKYMSIENFGLLTQVQVIVSIATIFALSGVDQLVQREFVNHNFTANECLNTVALLKLACFLISYPITALFCIIVFDKNLAILVSVFYPYVLFVALKVYASSLICEGKFLKFLSISSFISTISFVVKFLSIYYHSDIKIILFSILLESLLYSLIFICSFYSNRNKCDKSSISIILFKKYISEGKYLVLSGGMILIYTKVDQLMISKMLGLEYLAQYSVALKFITLYLLASSASSLAFAHKLSDKSESLYKHCKQLIVISLVLGSLLSLLNYFFTPILINWFYDEKFLIAKDYAKIMSPLIFFGFLLTSTGRLLVTFKLSKIALYRNTVALVFNIVLNFYFIPRVGVVGAIYTSIFCYLISSIIYILIDSRSRIHFVKVFSESN